MKKIISFSVLLVLAACNNNAGNNNADIPEKEKQLRQAISEHPDSLLLTENLIQYFRDNSNYSEAIAETDKALQKDSINERLLYIKATLHSENDDTLHAIQSWERLIKVRPDPQYLMSLGTLYAFTKDPLALAMGDLLMSPAGGNAQYQGLFIKGLYLANIGNKKDAILIFNKCIEMDYTNMLAYREKAIAEYDSGEYLEGLKTLELAITLKKDYDEAYYWAGRCYEKLGKKQEAIDNYRMALNLSPDYIEAKDALGKMGIVE